MYKKISGVVIHGEKKGKQLGFPTANIFLKKGSIPDGTYKINVLYKDVVYKGAGVYRENLGFFESHIFNFKKSIYDEPIEIIVLEKLRDNKLFNNVSELKLQIEKDIETINKMEDYVLTFGTFDVIHPGHKHFLKEAKRYGDKLITVVATDENVKKFKGKLPKYDKVQRFEDVQGLKIADEVCIGGGDRPLIRIELYKPKVVCLGYDQIGFADKLDSYIKEKNLKIKIIRIAPYKPEEYKSSLIKKKENS